MGTCRLVPAAAIIDIDGTLVDTNYHHALAWYRAFRQQGIVVPLWKIHRKIGMGGEKLIPDLIGDEAAREHGDEVRAAEKPLYLQLIDEVSVLPGARALLEDLERRGHRTVLASSAKPHEAEHYVDLLNAREIIDGWVTGGDVEATKPESDLIEVALERAGAQDGGDGAALVGDSVWDCEAARRAGIETIGLLTGGFAEGELREAGAVCVFESLEELRGRLDDTPLGRG